ncbi:S8 family peptidase [Nocardioides panacisoli]|uniref:Peptidase S8/S53 domain-containing protein n=1 Tax=Nocardioides panacisoli TaxID=627624 RepID=A0ABP7IWY3_9ACTN
MRPQSRRLRATVPALLAAALSLVVVATPAESAQRSPAVSAHAETRTVIVTGSRQAVRDAKPMVSGFEGYQNLPIIHGFAADLTDQQVAALEATGLHVSDNAPVTVNDADWGAGSHDASAVYPQADGAPAAWASGVDGHGVGVAVIDTGISNTGDLAGRVVDGYDLSGEGSYATDSFGHGTFVAGIIAGSGVASGGAIKGVAPGVDLISLKVAGANGSSDVVRVITAIQWAVNHAAKDNIRVLNLSLGTDSTQNWRIDPLDAAVEGAWRSGMVVTVAAGNSGPGGISKPGDDPYVITVGATDDATTADPGDDTVAPFSSTGPTAAGIAKPDLVAPGAHVVSTRASGSSIDTQFPASRIAPVYFRGSGTSFAAPQAAGAVALLLQQRPDLTNNQVKAMLTGTAVPVPGAPATAQGAGRLNIAALLAAPAGAAANQGLLRSDGSGSLFSSEGSLVNAGAPTGDSAAWNSAAWNSAAWNSAAWNSAAWNSAAWNSAAWNTLNWNGYTWNALLWNSVAWSSAAWNAYEWAGAAWNGYDWHSAAWNSAAWNSAAWNSAAWNSAAWNSAAWNSAAWNSAAWNAGGWASTGFWSAAWN